MPPSDKQPESVIRYLTRLLAALALQAGGELRIPLKAVRLVSAEGNRQALLEDTNIESDELVLRFGSKNSAVYPVEPEPVCDSPKPRSVSPQTNQPAPVPPSKPVTGRPPFTDQQLAEIELKARRMRAAAAMKRGREQANSLEVSDLNFPD